MIRLLIIIGLMYESGLSSTVLLACKGGRLSIYLDLIVHHRLTPGQLKVHITLVVDVSMIEIEGE